MRELRSHLGRHQVTPMDAEAEKRAAWREHGILVIADHDPRLTWPERELMPATRRRALWPTQDCNEWLDSRHRPNPE